MKAHCGASNFATKATFPHHALQQCGRSMGFLSVSSHIWSQYKINIHFRTDSLRLPQPVRLLKISIISISVDLITREFNLFNNRYLNCFLHSLHISLISNWSHLKSNNHNFHLSVQKIERLLYDIRFIFAAVARLHFQVWAICFAIYLISNINLLWVHCRLDYRTVFVILLCCHELFSVHKRQQYPHLPLIK